MKIQVIKAAPMYWYSRYINSIFNVIKVNPDDFEDYRTGVEYKIIKYKNPKLKGEFINGCNGLYLNKEDCKLIEE